MPPSSSFVALGGLAQGLGDAYATKQQQDHQDEQDRIRMVSNIVAGGLSSGSVKPEDTGKVFQYMLQQFGGKGGKGKSKPLPPALSNVINATHAAGSQGGPQADPTGGTGMLTPQQIAQQQSDAALAAERQKSQQVTIPEKQAESDMRIKEYEARYGSVDKATLDRAKQLAAAAGDPDNFDAYLKPAADALTAERKQKTDNANRAANDLSANRNQPKGALGQRIQELTAQGIPVDRAPAVAAKQLETERGVKQQQAATRLGAYLNLSRTSLLKNQTALDEMQQAFPYLLQAKIAGADIADVKASGAGKSDPSKIVEQATKTAHTLAGKQNSVLTGLGLEDDEETIRQNLIRELSGGQDPTAVEAAAKDKAAPSTKPAAAKPKAFRYDPTTNDLVAAP